MKKKIFASKPEYDSNNPMLDVDGAVDLPILYAEAYDAPLPYSGSLRHMRSAKTPSAKNEVEKSNLDE